MVKKLLSGMAFLIMTLLMVVPAVSQDGSGIIVVPNSAGEQALAPLVCSSPACRRLTWLLFPEMVSADPHTGELQGASPDNRALILDPQLQEGNLQTFKLRDDLLWSDGQPITAYDVMFSYLAVMQGVITVPNRFWEVMNGLRVVDEHTVTFDYSTPDCASLPRSNIQIVPSHIFDPDFATFVNEMNRQSDDVEPFLTWANAYDQSHFYGLQGDHLSFVPDVTAGVFHFDQYRPAEDLRFSARDTAFVYATQPDALSSVDYFLAGKTNILINPPYEQRDDLRATPDLQIVEPPGVRWDYIIFNTANPRKPKSAFTDSGVPIEQGVHPLFSDIQVRRAVQMGIDVQELINAVFQGNADPIASSLPPTSWGYNPDLQPSTYDPVGAARLLESAGWKDADQDGVRECHGCLNASEGTLLAFSLSVQDDQYLSIVASIIARQLSMIGFSVNVAGGDSSTAQTFDAFLTGDTVNPFLENNNPDQSAQFTRAADVLYQGGNVGSYVNEQVESLMQQARTVPGCVQSTRAELYRQAQALLQEDQPYAWLYVRRDMFIARNTVQGFAPIPGNPFWNVRDWVVTP